MGRLSLFEVPSWPQGQHDVRIGCSCCLERYEDVDDGNGGGGEDVDDGSIMCHLSSAHDYYTSTLAISQKLNVTQPNLRHSK